MTQTTRRSFTRLALALPALAALPHGAEAADEPVRIGCTYPFTGVAASAGIALRGAVEVALDIVNNAHPDLDALPLGAGAGLPNLGGRKVDVSFADHQGNPATAQSQTLRLISQDHVAAMIGSYQSSCTLTSSQVAERYGIPFVAGEFERAQPDRTRLQVVLPHDPDRHRFRPRLCRVPERDQGQGHQDPDDRDGRTRTPSTAPRRAMRSSRRSRTRSSTSICAFRTTPTAPMSAPRCSS